MVEMHPWWSEDIFSKPAKPMKIVPMFFVFLTRGEKWTPEKTPATEEIQKGHIANINRLAEMKKLMIGASAKLAELLAMKETKPEEYWRQLKFFNKSYCGHWEK